MADQPSGPEAWIRDSGWGSMKEE